MSKAKKLKNNAGALLVGRGAELLVQANGRQKTIALLIELIEAIAEGRE